MQRHLECLNYVYYARNHFNNNRFVMNVNCCYIVYFNVKSFYPHFWSLISYWTTATAYSLWIFSYDVVHTLLLSWVNHMGAQALSKRWIDWNFQIQILSYCQVIGNFSFTLFFLQMLQVLVSLETITNIHFSCAKCGIKMLKGALDNFSLIPQFFFFFKKLRFLYHKKCIPT